MITKAVLRVSSSIEGMTGVVLVIVPVLFVTMLLGVAPDGSGIVIAWLTGIALFCLAVAVHCLLAILLAVQLQVGSSTRKATGNHSHFGQNRRWMISENN